MNRDIVSLIDQELKYQTAEPSARNCSSMAGLGKESLMKFFLDTANLNEIREGTALGLVDGVTTNPSLVAKEGGVDFKQHVPPVD